MKSSFVILQESLHAHSKMAMNYNNYNIMVFCGCIKKRGKLKCNHKCPSKPDCWEGP